MIGVSKKRMLLAAIWTFGCLGPSAYAEELGKEGGTAQEEATISEDSDTEIMPEIVVTATRIPQSVMEVPLDVVVVKPADWEAKGAINVADALQGVPGVTVQGYGGASGTTSVRINGSDRIVVLVDGKRMNLPQGLASGSGSFDLKDLNLDGGIERIEVVRGGGSALYGSDAVGGVVQIFTKKGQGKVNSSITLTGGDDEKFKMNLMTSGSSGKNHWRINTDYFSTNGQRENSYNREGNLSLRFDHDINFDSSFYVIFDHKLSKRGNPGRIDTPSITDYAHTKTDTVGLGYLNKNMKLQVYQLSRDLTGSSYQTDIDHKNRVQVIDYQDSRKIGKYHELTWGGHLEWDRVDSSSYDRVRKNHSEAIFIQDQIQLGKKVLLTPGLRYENHSEYGDKWLPKVGIVYQPQDKLSFYANWGKVFKAPNFDQLYWYESWGSFGGMYGNPNLQPETGFTTEAGIKYQINPNHYVSATFFHRELNDAIRWVGRDYPGYVSIWSSENIDSFRTQGFTIAWDGKFGKGFSMDANYTYQDTDATVNYNEARHQFHAGLHYQQGKWKQSLLMDAASTTENGTGAFEGVPGWAIFTLSTQYQINEKNKVFFSLHNVFDKTYQTVYGYPEDGRNFLVGWKMDF